MLLILLFAAPLARYIPLAVLSAMLLFVAYNMGEWREIRELPARLIARADFHRHVGDANICANLPDALERAAVVHSERQSKTGRPGE